MNSTQKKQQLTSKPKRPSWPWYCRRLVAATLSLLVLALIQTAIGQTTVSANFDGAGGNDVGFTHYAPLQTPPWNEQVTWTFPSDPPGFSYRIFGGIPDIPRDPASGQDTGPARVGSFRNDATYSDFFTGVDIMNWDNTVPANLGIIAFRVNSPGFLTTFGYLAGYANRIDFRDQQGSFIFVEFQSELNVTELFGSNTGGLGLVAPLKPAGKYRMVATGSGANLRAAIYDRTDLLEPIVKIGVANSDVPSGTSGIAAVSYDSDDDKPADFTFDNYYSSPAPTAAIGFPGTPQVINVNPAPQTLFYQPPANGSNITFNIATFSTTQIDTNVFAVYTNGAQVPSSLLALTEVTDPIVGTHKTNFFVKYTGPLASDTIYNVRIVVLDTTGKGTTNNFVFDTFSTSGTLIVEAEDYNFNGGQFMDNPPVSGLDTNGNVSGGSGYYLQTGTRDVDYFDTDSGTSGDNHQYRPDGVGTAQNLFVGDTPRPDHVAANVPDYNVWRMQAGEWLNYTRTFLATHWNVYLRTSSQAREDVRFDQVTGDRTQPNQTKLLRGNFLVPNTGSSTRFRYVPLTDSVGNPIVVDFSGINTFRITPLGGFDSDRQHGGDANGSLQPTYFLFMPTTSPTPTTPWIAYASPSANATDVSVQPTVQIIVLERTSGPVGSIQLRFDGSSVTPNISNTTTEGAGATVTYTPPGFLQPNSTHTISLVFSDGTTTQSNQWAFTVQNLPVIPAAFALASAPGTNFAIQISKAPNDLSANPGDTAPFTGSTWAAERHVANKLYQPSASAASPTPYTNEASNTSTNFGIYVEPAAINYQQCGLDAGFFPGDKNFPGIYPSNYVCGDLSAEGPDHFAMAATINLQLGPGLYRMGVRSDDGFKVTVGTNTPPTDLILGLYDSTRGSVETTFDFLITNSGVYNFRLLYSEVGGGSDCEWYWVNRTTGARELVRPLALQSSATVNGPYSVEAGALIDPGAKTITVPKSGNTRFYRLSSSTAYTLGKPTISGSNVMLTYQ